MAADERYMMAHLHGGLERLSDDDLVVWHEVDGLVSVVVLDERVSRLAHEQIEYLVELVSPGQVHRRLTTPVASIHVGPVAQQRLQEACELVRKHI